MAVKTNLGWVLMGESKHNKREVLRNFLCDNSSVVPITKTFKTFGG